MLTQGTVRNVHRFYTSATLIGALPFSWNAKTRKFNPSSKIQQIRFLVTLTGFMIIGLNLCSVTVENLVTKKQAKGEMLFECLCVAYIAWIIILAVNVWAHRFDFACFLNEFYSFHQNLSDEYNSNSEEKQSSSFQRLVLLMSMGCYTGPLFSIMADLLNPNIRLYASLRLYRSNLPTWLVLPFVFLECSVWAATWHTAFLYWFLLMLVSKSVSSWFRFIAQSKSKRLNPRQGYKIYQSLCRIVDEFNWLCCYSYTGALKVSTLVHHSVVTYAIVVFNEELELFLLFLMMIGFGIWLTVEVITFSLAGQIAESSMYFCRTFGLPSDNGKTMTRQMKRALRVAGIRVGNLYLIRRGTPLVFISVVITLATNMILMKWFH